MWILITLSNLNIDSLNIIQRLNSNALEINVLGGNLDWVCVWEVLLIWVKLHNSIREVHTSSQMMFIMYLNGQKIDNNKPTIGHAFLYDDSARSNLWPVECIWKGNNKTWILLCTFFYYVFFHIPVAHFLLVLGYNNIIIWDIF